MLNPVFQIFFWKGLFGLPFKDPKSSYLPQAWALLIDRKPLCTNLMQTYFGFAFLKLAFVSELYRAVGAL